ncbi:MAG: molybdopterin molybdotransferase MoeA [Sediminimonas sp.]|uniref:molybdopterin molybdotransferase MoeA n=1 Tax=Sediminimonas sp. TaxID=2823379 RepID=UPI00287060F9|nr:gephyrin-like molybdotransferase Glp [Sediminimonas sp.]MDR9484491.1 molybdopterin molybdotransferase MoeA [Sediminimonas sp.]
MITVDEALEHLFALVGPLDVEEVPLGDAAGRVLARQQTARRDQPPFAASAMDGYAIRAADLAPGARFDVVGDSAAGARFDGSISPGQTVRIFTGAPMPEGADRVVIQEDCTREGAAMTITGTPGDNRHVRAAGADFTIGHVMDAPRRLSPADIALLAAMNVPRVPVTRRPEIALISTGDELVMPGEAPGPDQIIASNTFGLKALAEEAGAHARLLPIARDSEESLITAFDLARGADLVVTIGGASVGDHDLVGKVAADLGMARSFYKVAMRPGKPLMAGRLEGSAMLGLPGNPVSAIVCGVLFLRPVIHAMLGLPPRAPARLHATLEGSVPENGPRQHFMRAHVSEGRITPFPTQDSALLSVLAQANALLPRPIGDGPRKPGERVEYIPI